MRMVGAALRMRRRSVLPSRSRVARGVAARVEELEEDFDAAVAGHLLAAVGRRRHVRQYGSHLKDTQFV